MKKKLVFSCILVLLLISCKNECKISESIQTYPEIRFQIHDESAKLGMSISDLLHVCKFCSEEESIPIRCLNYKIYENAGNVKIQNQVLHYEENYYFLDGILFSYKIQYLDSLFLNETKADINKFHFKSTSEIYLGATADKFQIQDTILKINKNVFYRLNIGYKFAKEVEEIYKYSNLTYPF